MKIGERNVNLPAIEWFDAKEVIRPDRIAKPRFGLIHREIREHILGVTEGNVSARTRIRTLEPSVERDTTREVVELLEEVEPISIAHSVELLKHQRNKEHGRIATLVLNQYRRRIVLTFKYRRPDTGLSDWKPRYWDPDAVPVANIVRNANSLIFFNYRLLFA
jgi:hypothetical protein